MVTFNPSKQLNNEQSYFETLLIHSPHLTNINNELMALLQLQIYKFTGGDSSVSKERAQSLMDSMIYVISIYLKSFEVEKAMSLIQEKNIHVIYQEALTQMQQWMKLTTQRVAQIQASMIITDYNIYNDTLMAGLNAFLTHYNYEYNALDTIITFDYPTLNPVKNKIGIEQFLLYLQFINLENEFCNIFSNSSIQNMLENYYGKYQLNIFNISQLLLKQILFKRLLHQELNNLVLTQLEIRTLYPLLVNKTKLELYNLLVNTFYQCMNSLKIENEQLIHYLYKGLSNLSIEIYYSSLHKCIHRELSFQKEKKKI